MIKCADSIGNGWYLRTAPLTTPAGRTRIPSETLPGQWTKTAWNYFTSIPFQGVVRDNMNGTEHDVLTEDDYEENFSSSGESD